MAAQMMKIILEKFNLNNAQINNFIEQKITPEIICHLSLYDFHRLGLVDKTIIMKLRVECIAYGNKQKSRDRTGGCFNIPKVAIESLLEAGFSIADTSRTLCVSESTLYRRMRQYNISKLEYTQIEDDDLDDVVVETLKEFPQCGEEMIRSLLLQKNVKVQRSRLRECLHRLDEDGIRERKKRRLQRRTYNVAGPNHLWHIDTNHKLIRWHLVIIGGIDGFSRLVTFLECSDNNKAETVFTCFKHGIQEYGTPMRVRSDQGLENCKVADFMIFARGPDRGSMITGKSTHNQRIERLWRDVYDGVLSYYYQLFYFLEDEGELDILNDVHVFALHHVYVDKINERLLMWRNAWSQHRVRTVNSSPLRLFTAGMMNNAPSEPNIDFDQYGVDGFVDDVDDDPRPTFVTPVINVSEECLNELAEQCPKTWISDNHGVDVYLRVKRILRRFNHQT